MCVCGCANARMGAREKEAREKRRTLVENVTEAGIKRKIVREQMSKVGKRRENKIAARLK